MPAGRFSFEVTDRKVPSVVTKRPLTEAELFAGLSPAFVILERLSPSGRTLGTAGALIREGSISRHALELVSAPMASSTPLTELWTRGEVLAAVLGDDHIVEGGFTRAMSKSEMRGAFETMDAIPMREKAFVAYVAWSPKERLRG